MPCVLTGSQPLDCKDAIGGIYEVKVKVHPGLTAIEAYYTISSGSVTAISSLGSSLTGWYTYGLEKQTASFKDDPQPSSTNGSLSFNQELKIIINKIAVRMSNEMRLLGQNRLLFAVRDMNGNRFFMGLKYAMDMTPSTSGSGTARTDRSGYELTFTGSEDLHVQFVSTAIYDTLVS
mgnify:CR=1 FL=1